MFTKEERRMERETIIRFDENKEEVSLFTASPPIKRKIERKGHRPDRISQVGGKEVGWTYALPYRKLRWGV